MIKRSQLFKKSGSSTPHPNANASSKMVLLANLLSKATKRSNLVNLGYFDFYLDRTYGKDEVVSVSKDVNYRNILLFVQHLKSLVTFK